MAKMENNNEQNDPIPQQPFNLPQLPTVNPEAFTNQQLAKFEYSEEYLKALVDKYKGLTIKGVDDKEGLKAVHDARIDLRDHRTAITKTGKNLREFSNEYNKAVLNRVSDLTSIISPSEDELQEREDEITAEKERIRKEKEKEESAKIDVRLKELAGVGAAVDFHDLKGMSDDHYAQILEDATGAHKAKLAQEEKGREIALERAIQEKAEREAENARLAKQREEQEAERKKMEVERMAFEKEQERVRQENAAKLKDFEDQQNRLAEQALKIQGQRNEARSARLMSSIYGIGYDPARKVFLWSTPDGQDKLALDYALTMDLDDEEFESVKDGAHVHVEDATERYQQRVAEKKKAEDERIEREKQEAIAKSKKEEEEKRVNAELEQKERLMQGDDAYRFSTLAHGLTVSYIDSAVWGHMRSQKGRQLGWEVRALIQKAVDICKENAREESPTKI